jgi:hypothetical protein
MSTDAIRWPFHKGAKGKVFRSRLKSDMAMFTTVEAKAKWEQEEILSSL